MDRDTSMGGADRVFPSTHWSMVLAAGDPANPNCRAKLDELLRTYWKPVYVFIRKSWPKTSEDCKDLTQAFFAYLLQKDTFTRLRPERGSFRGYISMALRHFLIDAQRYEKSRLPATPLLHIDYSPDEVERLNSLSASESPEDAYEREWFASVFASAVDDLARHLEAGGKGMAWTVFKTYCLGSESSATYQQLAKSLGIREADVRNHLYACRNLLRQYLRARIRMYVSEESEIDAELAAVLKR